ncbi:MAG: thioredoxin domain-containing protein [Planctomycetia bacterium]
MPSTSNALADSTSPYLLQHADNPVHWQPWSPEALARAAREDRPIFLSVGYSACHWCHVMAHESFENESIAAILNEHFVNIKVDREERPDLDAVYMSAVQLLTGRGGWPMSVFLTPDLEPFFAGTYWPPEQRGGMAGFPQVLHAVIDAWRNRREQVSKQAGEITEALSRSLVTAGPDGGGLPDAGLLEQAARSLERMYDPHHGGFGAAPKFPHPMDLRLLLRTAQRSGRIDDVEMAANTLACMAAGGIHDHLGGGFARYSVDARWLVPHFEKMLYDNALLAVAYLEAHQATGRADFAAVVRSTLDYLIRDMTDPAGGFWAAEDADSEGEEGKFYVWSPEEIFAVLGEEEGRLFCEAYDVTPRGNFEGHSILNLPRPLSAVARAHGIDPRSFEERMANDRSALRIARGARVRPGTDDKLLVAWNGLAIDAFARAGAVLGEPRYTEAAARAAAFILSDCRDAKGRLAHQWRKGRASGLAFAEDLACLAEGLVSLYEATFDERWVSEACGLVDHLLGEDDSGPLHDGGFLDPETGAFFRTSPSHESLIIRQHDMLDNATPSATGMAATVLVRLAMLTGRERYRAAAERAILAVSPLARRSATASSQTLLALDMLLGPAEQVVVVADASAPLVRDTIADVVRRFRPRAVIALRPRSDALPVPGTPRPLDPLFADRTGAVGDIMIYECTDATCAPPRRLGGASGTR